MVKTLYINMPQGICGDMLVAALIDLIGEDEWRKQIESVNAPFQAIVKSVEKCGVSAKAFFVKHEDQKDHRHLPIILDIIDESKLSDRAKSLAKDMFYRIADAESIAHDCPRNQVHFHEVGAIDSIVDILSIAILIDLSKAKRIYASLPMVGHGTIEFCHGTTNLPVPATRLLLDSVPKIVRNVALEMTTPTGATALAALVDEYIPELDTTGWAVGKGAGRRDLDVPNVIEVYLGDHDHVTTKITVIESNIDDMNPELLARAGQVIMEKGALDVSVIPTQMKKGRVGMLLQVRCRPQDRMKLTTTIFEETTTFGVRYREHAQVMRSRKIVDIQTKYGVVKCKKGDFPRIASIYSPEYESCKEVALAASVPVREVYLEVIAQCRNL
jgi:pyridinium-3,5-bisthiocarboxylic acid mononucleotide nickel chelatase